MRLCFTAQALFGSLVMDLKWLASVVNELSVSEPSPLGAGTKCAQLKHGAMEAACRLYC